MNSENRVFRGIAWCTACVFSWSMLLAPALALAQTGPAPTSSSEIVQACDQAEADAKSGHSGAGYGVGGFFCGVFGLIFAVSSNPQVPAEKILGKSPDYVSTYTRCYKQEAKSKNVRASLIGWGAAVVVVTIIIVAADNSSSGSGY